MVKIEQKEQKEQTALSTFSLTYENASGIRRKDRWINQLAVMLNGKKLGKIRLGETIHYECTAGEHTLGLSMGLGLRSQKILFSVQPGECATFKCARDDSWKIHCVYSLPMFLSIFLTLMIARNFFSTWSSNWRYMAVFIMPMVLITFFQMFFFKLVPGILFLDRESAKISDPVSLHNGAITS